jgi:uncharacterized LabA/DUF88 family protein
MPYPYPEQIKPCRAMLFVDGENLSIRYGRLLSGGQPLRHVLFERNVYVWAPILNLDSHASVNTVRRHYYTSISGDADLRDEVHDKLQSMGMHTPRVFPKNKTKGSKRVDISLSADMLTHCHLGNYDVAVLVAGDEDYVPLVEAVKAQGRQVLIWFVSSGLSPALRRSADYFFNLDTVLLNENAPRQMGSPSLDW